MSIIKLRSDIELKFISKILSCKIFLQYAIDTQSIQFNKQWMCIIIMLLT